MKKRNYFIPMVAILLLGTGISSFLPTSGALEDHAIVQMPMDIGPELRSKQVSHFPKPSIMGPTVAQDGEYHPVGTILQWYTLDEELEDELLLTDFELREIGKTAEIWVQVDMSYPDNRDVPVITDEQVTYMLAEFDDNIRPTDTQYFGEPDFLDGSEALLGSEYYGEENGRDVILISNIRDTAYYDDSYPYYIVGFYWGVFETAFDRNIISIDCADWENRVGDDVAIPNLYEGTVAHEYQHLIHDDKNPDDDTFMNEGCSMYAEPLCGYNIAWGDIQAYLATPDNSLTEWGDQGDINILADYGSALMWAIYLSDHHGGAALLADFVQSGVPGIQGLNEALSRHSPGATFDSVYHDWRIANLLHTDVIGDGLYNYISFDLNDETKILPEDTRIYDVKRPSITDYSGSDFGITTSYLNDRTEVDRLGSYGSDYIKFSNIKSSFNPQFLFDGDDVADTATWLQVDEGSDGDADLEWYSTDAGNEADISIVGTIDLDSYSSSLLSFDTKMVIEEIWDFGFVQISTDSGLSWTSLENDLTTYEFAEGGYPAIEENLPGLTGETDGWITATFDLGAYSGPVMLGFRYMTDWSSLEEGWYVDNIKIGDVLIDNADDVNLFTCPPQPETDFIVTLIGVDLVDGVETYTQIETLDLKDLDETSELISFLDYVGDDGYILVIVSCTMGPTDYMFSVLRS